jgi:hypothetical protein
MSPLTTDHAAFYFVVFLVALLAVSITAVIRTPPESPSQAEPEADELFAEPDLAQPLIQAEPVPALPLPKRVPAAAGAMAGHVVQSVPEDYAGRHVRPPKVSGQPPWGPAPRPPDLFP